MSVKEIPYELYQEFCSKLPCKDIFYYLNNLFIQRNGKIYSIKSKVGERPVKVFEELKNNKELHIISFDEFLRDLPSRDSLSSLREENYKNKSFLIVL